MGLLVFLCFFLSGASGLVFEVLWTRELGLVFGSTTLAMSTVLSVYMGGLALGSFLAGRRTGRIRRPLRAYALVEACVGLYALAVPLLLSRYPALNSLLWRSVGDHYAMLSLLRFAATALLLLLPTTLMGATLPLLSQFLSSQRRARGVVGASVQIGTLFSLNTAGAVLGTFLAGFELLPGFGVTRTNYLAAATNLTLAIAILWAERRIIAATAAAAAAGPDDTTAPEPDAPDAAPDAETPDPDAPAVPAAVPTARQRRLAVAAYGISGATAMVYQVLWTRALAIVLGSSIYSFTIILLAFLFGLAAGAALCTRLLARLRRPVLALGVCHALTLVTAAWSYATIDRLPEVFLLILRGGSFSVDELLITQFVLAALAMLPATLAMGGVMPLTMRIYTASVDGAGHDVGVAYALNTLGAITGSFLAGFVVLPQLGLQRGLLLCALLTSILSAVLLWSAEQEPPARLRRPLALGLVALTCAFALWAPPWNLSHFSAGLFRVSIAKSIIYLKNRILPKLLYYKDGTATTVSVEQWDKTIALKNNGKVDASNGDDMGTQIMVGLMPLLFHPTALDKPPSVAVIGYGSGVTIGAVTQFPIGHADVIELEPAVVEAGDRFFAEVNHTPSRNPAVNVVIGDGRNFMTQSERRYDVIVSEPSNPWITGVSNLFTIDYWQLANSRLADDGVFCQWAQLYELSQPNIKTLLKSFSHVFPHTYVFAAEHLSSDVILVASRRPLPLDYARLARNFTVPALRAELQRAAVSRPEDILADLLLAPDELPAFTAGALLNTDDNARIEFAAPRDLLGYMRHESSVPKIYSAAWPYGRFERYLVNHGTPLDLTAAAAAAAEPRGEVYGRLGTALLSHGKRDAAGRLLVRALAVPHGAAAEHLRQLLMLFIRRDVAEHEEPLSRDWDGDDDHFAAGLTLTVPAGLGDADAARVRKEFATALRELEKRRWVHALRELREWPMSWIDQMGPDVRLVLGYLLYKLDMVDNAVDHLSAAVAETDWLARHPAALYYLARAEYENGDPRASVRHMERYLEVRP